MKRILLLLLLLVLATSCQPATAHLAADQATHDAIAPEYIRYVDADSDLSQPQKDRRHRTIAAWRARLEAAERANR